MRMAVRLRLSSQNGKEGTNGNVEASESGSGEKDSDKEISFDAGTAGDSDTAREAPDQQEEKATDVLSTRS